jgi:TonB family protein
VEATVLEDRPWRERGLLVGAVAASILAHLALAESASRIPPREHPAPVWVEMAIATAEPPPEPPPPEPEPAPPPKPEVVDYKPPKPDAPPPPPVPQAKPVPREIQGLSNESFLPGAGTGVDVRMGNTTAAKATKDALKPGEDATFTPIPYASVTDPPKLRYKPEVIVPPEVIAAGLEGTVDVVLTIDDEGKVVSIEVVSSLSKEADAACVAALKTSRWKPGDKDGSPAIVRGVPYACRFQQTAQ